MRYVVAGLHAAGRSACAWLRKADSTAEIVGVDPSPAPLYSRPLISYALAGEMTPEQMTLAGEEYFAALGVSLVRDKAAALDLDRGKLTLASGRELAFDRLLLACGARARPPGVGGPLAGEICLFRGRADLGRILDRIKPGGQAAVLGGGLVGFKLTMGLLAQGMSVTLIVASPRPLALNVDAHVGGWLAERFMDTPGVTLMTNTSVVAAEAGTKRPLRLVLSRGEPLEVDLAASGKGVIPVMDWLAGSGLSTADGVLCDNRLSTSDPRVFAAGDLAQVPDLALGEKRVNAIWPVAVEQGRVAALAMAGLKTSYPGSMAANSIPVFGAQMISVGAVNPALTQGSDSVEAEGRNGRYLSLVFREKRLIGAVGLNAPPRLGELAFAIRQGLSRREIPGWWLANVKNAAPLAARGGLTASVRRP